MPTAAPTRHDTAREVAELKREVAELKRQVAQLAEQIRQGTQHRRGPRDEHERAVLDALVRIVGVGTPFQAADVLERGTFDSEFHQLLAGADLVEIRPIGYLLRQAKGQPFGGARLDSCGRGLWQFVPDACGIAQP